jgi:hypothetical protein
MATVPSCLVQAVVNVKKGAPRGSLELTQTIFLDLTDGLS